MRKLKLIFLSLLFISNINNVFSSNNNENTIRLPPLLYINNVIPYHNNNNTIENLLRSENITHLSSSDNVLEERVSFTFVEETTAMDEFRLNNMRLSVAHQNNLRQLTFTLIDFNEAIENELRDSFVRRGVNYSNCFGVGALVSALEEIEGVTPGVGGFNVIRSTTTIERIVENGIDPDSSNEGEPTTMLIVNINCNHLNNDRDRGRLNRFLNIIRVNRGMSFVDQINNILIQPFLADFNENLRL